MLAQSRLGKVNDRGGLRKVQNLRRGTVIILVLVFFLMLGLYSWSSEGTVEITPSTVRPMGEIRAEARAYFQKLESVRKARDDVEKPHQLGLLEKYKQVEAQQQQKQKAERKQEGSILSSYTPEPKMVPVQEEQLHLTQFGVCSVKEACNLCISSDLGCSPTKHRALFQCSTSNLELDSTLNPLHTRVVTKHIAGDNLVSDLFIQCETALVDGRQSFWVFLGLCASGAVLAAALFKSRLQHMIIRYE